MYRIVIVFVLVQKAAFTGVRKLNGDGMGVVCVSVPVGLAS